MTLRIIGAILIIGTCTAVGYKMSAAYKTQEQQLEQLIGALLYIRCELTYRLTPLPQQFEQCCTLTDGAVRDFFRQIVTELAAQISPNAGCCLMAALDKTVGLTPMVREALHRFGKTLGQFDLEGQIQSIDEAIEYTRRSLAILEKDHVTRVRNYRTIGICAGAALTILFI